MEDLRNMYRTEMDAQTETYEKERDKFRQLESSLSETLKVKRQEADTYRAKYLKIHGNTKMLWRWLTRYSFRADEYESKSDELTRRLENQTAEVLRLTLELEEYEYKDFGTANNSNHHNDEGESDYEYVENDEDDGKEPW